MNNAFWRTMVPDTSIEKEGDEYRCSPRDGQGYRKWARGLEGKKKHEDDKENDIERKSGVDDEGDVGGKGDVEGNVEDNCQFIFGQKGYIGIGPLATKAGDVICVVPGSNLPLMLRPSASAPRPNTFKFLGFCYVHGIMDGEAVDPAKFRRGTPEERIRRQAFGGQGLDLDLLGRLPEDIYLE